MKRSATRNCCKKAEKEEEDEDDEEDGRLSNATVCHSELNVRRC